MQSANGLEGYEENDEPGLFIIGLTETGSVVVPQSDSEVSWSARSVEHYAEEESAEEL